MLYLKIQGNSKQHLSRCVLVCVIYVHTWKQANLNTMWQFKRLIITQASLKTKIEETYTTGYVTLIKTAMYWCKSRQSQNSKRIKSKNIESRAGSPIPSFYLRRHWPNNNTGTNSLCERPTSQLIDFYTAGSSKGKENSWHSHAPLLNMTQSEDSQISASPWWEKKTETHV